MGLFIAPLRAVIGHGSEHSNLGAIFEQVAGKMNWAIRPDPNPAARIFVRSDQYSFVREGVPALYLSAAAESTDPNIDLPALTREWTRTRYHKPSDDLQQPIHYESIGAFAMFAAEIVRAIGDSETKPAWLPGDFFGELFGKR
jgi:Zn-dependent M28 family amino/carboxypeptidase